MLYSCIWQFKGKKSNPTYTKAITNEGSYKVGLQQLLYGIPYFSCSEVYDDGWKGKWLTDARVSVAHRGIDGYMVLTSLWEVEEVVYDDVQLLTVEDAKAAFETKSWLDDCVPLTPLRLDMHHTRILMIRMCSGCCQCGM